MQNLIVKRGTLMLPRVKRGLPSVALRPGDALPAGALADAEVARLVTQGILGPRAARAAELPAEHLPPTRGRWVHDPATLIGKTVEELMVLVVQTDPDHPVLAQGIDVDEGALIRALTADYDPLFAAGAPRADDSTRIEITPAARKRAAKK